MFVTTPLSRFSPLQSQSRLGLKLFSRQVNINTGVGTPQHMTPSYLNHLDLGEAVAALVERRSSSHAIFTVNSPADLKTAFLERDL